MKKLDRLLIRGVAQLVTLRGSGGPRRGSAMSDLGIVENGAMLIRDGIIEHVGPSHRIENLEGARDAEIVDATGSVVLPGFVDSHTHLVHAQPRLEEFPWRVAENAGAQPASSSRLRAQAQTVLQWMASHGATTVEAKSGLGLDEAGETRILRIINGLDASPAAVVPTLYSASAAPAEFAGNPDGYLKWRTAVLLPLVARRRLAQFADVVCRRGGFSLQEARVHLAAARRAGLKTKMHAGPDSIRGAVQLAVEMQAVSVDHLDGISSAEIEALAGSRTIATLIPGLSFHTGSEVRPPARALIDAGAAVALATGFDGVSCPSCSMPMTLSLACTMLRMTPAEAITAATINGAYALDCAATIGSLEPGKQGDFAILAVRDYRELPYYFGVQTITRVFRRGVEISSERK
jgi:imidazolonepropionase